MFAMIFVTFAVVALVVQGGAVIKKEKLSIINSDTLPGNLLPSFMFMQGAIEGGAVGVNIGGGRGTPKPFIPDDSCGDDIFEGANPDLRSPQLPYLTQDLWTCDRKQEDIDVYTYENDALKVTITPQYAGKVWGIYDKKREKELLFANRAHQPANIAALHAWAAGGAEWNYSPGIIGHSAFSETRTFLTQLSTTLGDVLRVYEYDRYNGTVWQVDMLITDDGAFLAHPRITNPTDVNLRAYWWTCVAVDSKPSTRLYTPATRVTESSRQPFRDSPWPFYAEGIENASFSGWEGQMISDQSYLGNHQIGDMFLRIDADAVAAKGVSPYIAHNQLGDKGYVYIHGHPLNGTKFFTWGQSGPGRFMQDFLAGGGKRQGDYTELQTGPAPTQMQTFPLANNSVSEWTEWFKGFFAKEEDLRGKDYNKALDSIESWTRSPAGMPQSTVQNYDTFFQTIATQTPDKILVEGQPWGALEELLLGKPLAPGLSFTLPKSDSVEFAEIKPWVELVNTGVFSSESLAAQPLSYQTTDRWLRVLELSVEKQGMTWLHALHLGVCYAERGEVTRPLQLFLQSAELSSKLSMPNPIALRSAAVLQSDLREAWKYYQQSWASVLTTKADCAVGNRIGLNLVSEISAFLQQNLWYDEMATFRASVKGDGARFVKAYTPDTFLTLDIKLLLNDEMYADAQKSLANECFPTYASARDDLMNMWNEAVEGVQKVKKYGVESTQQLTPVEAHQARMSDMIPDNIGCQYASEYCINYW